MRATSQLRKYALAASVLGLLVGLDTPAFAISYQAFNHPDGGQIGAGETVDTGGYILRLDVGGVNTFNANNTTGVFFSFDPGTNKATLSGLVTHNESGSTTAFDLNDDVWHIDAVFEQISLTDDDDEPSLWFSDESPVETFDDMIDALRTDDNDPDRNVEQSPEFSDDVARIYFRLVDLTLTLSVDGGMNGYGGPTAWDEFPNDPDPKQFFLQYRWRLWDPEFAGEEFDQIGAAGWLESPPGSGEPSGCCQDFLFTLSTERVPEPGSTALLVLGAVGLMRESRRRRRRRR